MGEVGIVDEVVQEFLVESYENLDRLDQEFVQLEQDPGRTDLVASVFRTIHTIKGTCGFLGFARLQNLAHAGETLLARLRDGKVALDAPRTTALLQMVDGVRAMLKRVEEGGGEGEDAYEPLIARLGALASGDTPAEPMVAPERPPTPPAPVAAPTPPLPAPTPPPAPPPPPVVVAPPPPVVVAPPPPVVAAPPAAPSTPPPSQGGPPTAASASEQSVRVDVDLLERLVNLVGELVLARNQLQQLASDRNDTPLTGVFQRIDLITSEIQEGMMKTRMQAVGSVWSKLPRLVRDVSARCGKQVRLEMAGQDTEVDRTLLDAIRDPLTHIVRNSIDHGIEAPDVREALGKPREGVIRLRAWHEGGQVNIEIVDDGAGVNTDRVRNKAIERGLITADQAARMTPRELQDLLFLPGFSTAEKVTNVSGRGVGMDVVRTDIAAVNGTVDLSSEQGAGTTIKLGIPLTLAIIPALMVYCHGQRFAIPQVSIVQLMRLDGKMRENGVATVHQTQVFRHRDELLPLLNLEDELQLEPIDDDGSDRQVVVLQSSERRFGLIVDRVGDCGEIVVKPLSRVIKPIGAYVGGTITGDGAVALILDVAGLARRARLMVESRDPVAVAAVAQLATDRDCRRLLIVGTPDDGRAAIELDGVNRLEEFHKRFVENLGGQEVVRYRGHILPLVRVSRVLLERRIRPRRAPTLNPSDPEMIQVIVHAGSEGPVGVVVDQIHDILDVEIGEKRPPVRAGVHFSTLIGDRVIELLDTRWLVAHAEKEKAHA